MLLPYSLLIVILGRLSPPDVPEITMIEKLESSIYII
jgi:hypothetical protein